MSSQNTPRIKKTLWTSLGVILVGAVLTAFVVSKDGANDQSSVSQLSTGIDQAAESASSSSVTAAQDRQEAPVAPSLSPDLPDSLKGTDVDGGFRVDSQGHLLVDKSVKRFFDYFLGTVGERSLEALEHMMEEMISQSLGEPAKSEALAILKSYLQYKQAVADLQAELGDINPLTANAHHLGDLEDRLARLKALRQSYLGVQVAEAFYGEQEVVDQYTLKKLTVLNDPSLSNVEKENKLLELAQSLPESIRQARHQDSRREQLADQIQELRQSGASEGEIFAARAAVMGTEKAERFATLDQARKDFQNRLAAYRSERLQLVSANLTPSDEAAEINRLREMYFNATEIRKVAVMDKHGIN